MDVTSAETSTPPSQANPEHTLRIGNASGFYGDRLTAFAEILAADVDVITGDYLAELTMLILARQKQKDPTQGYARSFLQQVTRSLGTLAQTGTRVVANAGGMNPSALAAAIRQLAEEADLDISVAYVDGDDLTDRAEALGLGDPLAANAYLGGFGITEALRLGAQIVVTGRVTDAALVTGPAAWYYGWGRDDFDRIAGAMAAGHVIECGMQATGGNFSFFTEIEDLVRPGFPIAEVASDGSSVITKQPGTGGAVTAETVLSQLLYEVGETRYPGPDATLRLDSLTLTDLDNDRVRISGVRGEAPPPDLKVSVTAPGGFRQEITFLLTGLNTEKKAKLIEAQFERGLELAGLPRPADMAWNLTRRNPHDATTQEEGTARLTLVARDSNPKLVGRAFANVAVEFMLGSVPGLFLASPPSDGAVYGRYRPAFVPQQVPAHTVHMSTGDEIRIAAPTKTQALAETLAPVAPTPGSEPSATQSATTGDRVQIPLGQLFGARSGDKGGNANVGVWARNGASWTWLRTELTSERLRELLPETAKLRIDRVELPKLRALNFVVHGLLGEGVASGARFDPQAKGVAEWLRSRTVEVPAALAQATDLDQFFVAEHTARLTPSGSAS